MSNGHPAGGALVGLPTGLLGGLAGGSIVNVSLPSGFCLFYPWLCPPSSGDGTFTPAEWGDRVRQASSHTGPFPKVSIWHGSADTTVHPVNATEEVEQWTNVHGLGTEPTVRDSLRRGFQNASKRLAAMKMQAAASRARMMWPSLSCRRSSRLLARSHAQSCSTTQRILPSPEPCAAPILRIWG